MTNSPLSAADQVLENITDPICAVDGDWKVTYMNGAAGKIFGPDEKWIGETKAALEKTSGDFPVAFDFLHEGSWFSAKAYIRKEGGAVICFRDSTAEVNLRQSRERLKRALQTARLGTWELDLATNKMTSSAACKANFGLSPYVDLSYKLLYKYIHAEDRQRVWDTVRQAIETGDNYQIEYRSIWPNRELHWILARGQVHYSGGEPQRLIGITMDITGLKGAEEIRQRYRLLFDAAPCPCLVLTPALKIEAANKACLETTMTRLEDIMGRDLFEVFPANPGEPAATGIPGLKASLQRVLVRGTTDAMAVQRYDLRCPPARGGGYEERYWGVINTPVIANDGGIIAILVYIEDVTGFVKRSLQQQESPAIDPARIEPAAAGAYQRSYRLQEVNEELRTINEKLAKEIRERKAAEEALRYSEERVRLIIESAKEYAIFTMDLNGRITSWNKGAEKLLGYREAEILGRDAALIYMPEDRESRMPVRERRKALLEDRAENERWQMRRDGSRFWASGLIMPLLNEAGSLHGYLNILRDHTEKKEMEEALQAALRETNSKNRELLRLNEYMDNFVHIIAHDLRSPLSTLRLVTDLIVQTDDCEQKMKYIPMIENAVNHLGNMMNDVIELISVQNKPESSVMQVSFGEVFEMVCTEYKKTLEECGASVHTDFACPRISYIRVFIQSILANLMGNAIKYKADDRQLEISVSTKREDDFIILRFRDNGMGMDLNKYGGNLFKPFTRFTNKAEGKGMGLHLVKSMVEKKGGRIEADSTPDKGTTFTVYLKEY